MGLKRKLKVEKRKRKLKKKFRKPEVVGTKELKPIKKKKYVRAKCAYHDEDGIRCKRNAVGKSSLCKKHGGDPIVLENTLTPAETQSYLITNGFNSDFQPEYHPIAFIGLSKDGKSETEIAAEFGVSVPKLKSWAEKFSEFALAYEIGQAFHETWWLEKGKAGLDSRNFNTRLYKFLTGNKLGYSEKIESKNLNVNKNIHGVLVVPDKMTIEEWEKSGEEQ